MAGQDLMGIHRVKGFPIDQGGVKATKSAIQVLGDELLVQPKW
jgi:hypothetical protein